MKKIIVVSLLSALLLSGCATIQEPTNYLDITGIQSSEIEVIPEASEHETETEESETTSEDETITEVETVSEPTPNTTSSESVKDKPVPENSIPAKTETTVPSSKKEEPETVTSSPSSPTVKDHSNCDPYYEYLDNPEDIWYKYMDGNVRKTKECIFEDINAERARRGLPAFVWDKDLEEQARLSVKYSMTFEDCSIVNGYENGDSFIGPEEIRYEIMAPKFSDKQGKDFFKYDCGLSFAADKLDNFSAMMADRVDETIMSYPEPCYIGLYVDSKIDEHFIDSFENERTMHVTYIALYVYYPC